MTIGELILELEQYDKDLEVGGSGHYGDILTIDSIYYTESRDFVIIEIENAGEEPN